MPRRASLAAAEVPSTAGEAAAAAPGCGGGEAVAPAPRRSLRKPLSPAAPATDVDVGMVAAPAECAEVEEPAAAAAAPRRSWRVAAAVQEAAPPAAAADVAMDVVDAPVVAAQAAPAAAVAPPAPSPPIAVAPTAAARPVVSKKFVPVRSLKPLTAPEGFKLSEGNRRTTVGLAQSNSSAIREPRAPPPPPRKFDLKASLQVRAWTTARTRPARERGGC